MSEAVRKQMVRARTALYIEDPFYGVLTLRLRMVEDISIPTACISHTTLYYNPRFIETLDQIETKTLVAHELLHILHDHINRRGGRHPGKWNAAADYVVNDVLVNTEVPDANGRMGKSFKLPKGGLYNPMFTGMTADHIYTLIPDSDGDPSSNAADSFGAMDSMKEGEGTAEERETADLDWKVAATQAAHIAKKQGKLPAGLERFIDDLVNNKVDWRAKLRKFATEISKTDTSWMRPQRRMLPFGYYLPSLHSESMGTFVSGIDTSGSIDDYTLQLFGAEIKAVRLAVNPLKMVNIYCDAEVAHVDEFEQTEELSFEAHGGGGTDFRPVFEYVESKSLRPACLIYLTDGYGSFPDTPAPYPVLWVMTTDVQPPWGEYVRIEA
jgi:predicted metal-dependent peptidase